LDLANMRDLAITIAGLPLERRLYRFRLWVRQERTERFLGAP
jgi:hypothetical protein